MDYGPFGVRFLFFNTKKERRSIDELLIYFATPPFFFTNFAEAGMIDREKVIQRQAGRGSMGDQTALSGM